MCKELKKSSRVRAVEAQYNDEDYDSDSSTEYISIVKNDNEINGVKSNNQTYTHKC